MESAAAVRRYAWTLLLVATAAAAECDKVEYAELQAKSRSNLEYHYCLSMIEATYFRDRAGREATAGVDSSRSTAGFARCADEGNRAAALLAKRHAQKQPPKCKSTLWNDGRDSAISP